MVSSSKEDRNVTELLSAIEIERLKIRFVDSNPTSTPFYFPSVLEFPYGLEILDKIRIIATEYNCETENIEECLRRLRLEGKLRS